MTVVSILSLKLFLTINREAVNIFYWDQWDFNDPILFAPRSLWGKFSYEHAPHRQGMGALVGWLVGSLSNWNTRAEAFTIAAIVLLACLCALWLKQRLYGSLSFVDAVVPMLFFTRVQWETYPAPPIPHMVRCRCFWSPSIAWHGRVRETDGNTRSF